MPPRSKRPHLSAEKPPVQPVETRHVFEDLAPSLRPVALKMAEGNPARIRVLSVGRFEILTEAELTKEAAAARTVKESVTVPVEREAPAKTTRSRKPRKITEPPAEKVNDQESPGSLR